MKSSNNFSISTDEELMVLLNKGEVAAFDELYARYGNRLMVYFTRMLNFDTILAQDALQDLFMKIVEAPERFDSNRSFKTWIFSIASNYCKNVYRHRNVVLQAHEEIENERTVNENAFFHLANKMDSSLFKNLLNETLNSLPLEKKEAFILKYQEDKSIAEIALIQNCPEGSVKSRLHYTIKMLETRLKIFDPQN
ncbi:MAG: RNA polymerase sigma factor [Bacteroidetes bacterium]|nr:RNA polymerase sigma factor [Bacteroidota bacterium]